MNKKLKRGFTIVELVIVIAVIGILAGILIPMFSNLVTKANVASDGVLVRELNNAIAMDAEVNGKHETINDALKATDEYGFNVQRINAKASQNKILWDSKNDVFCYLKDGVIEYISFSGEESQQLQAGDYRLWIISKNVDADYSTYLYNYTGNGVIETSKGLDVGEENVTSVTYSHTGPVQIVDIRTNGGTLTIEAPNDDVYHYGYADSVNIKSVANSSYHAVDAEVKFLEIAGGHVVLEEQAKVNAVHFTATGEGENAKFQNAEGKKISIDLSKVQEEAMPTFTRDAVTIEENGTYVAEVKTESTEYIWLFGQGIKEQMVVSNTTGAIAQNGTLKAGVEVGAEDGSVAEQIANPAKRNDDGQLLDENDEVIDLTNVDLKDSSALEDTVVVEEVADKEDVQTGAVAFAGGTGSESDPFLIENRDHLFNTGDYYNKNYYFKVKDGVTEIDCSNWTKINYFGGTVDGNGVTLINLDKPLIQYVYDGKVGSTVTLKNMNVNCNMHYNIDRAALVVYSYVKNIAFDNVNVSGLIESSMGCSAYVGYGAYGYNFYHFNNCVSNVTLVATGGAASGFVNHPGYSTYEGSNPSINAKIFITDSIYNGRMSATGSSVEKNNKFKYFVYNSNGLAVTTKYSDEFVQEYGNPEGTLYAVPTDKKDNKGNVTVAVVNNEDGSKTFNAGNSGSNLVDYYRPGNVNNMKSVLTSMNVALPAKGSAFEFAKVAGASRVVVTLEIGGNDANGYGNYVATYEIEEINVASYATGATITTSQILNFRIVVEPASTSTRTTGAEGDYYYVVSGRNGSTYGSAVVRISQYDANGNILATKAVSIA